MRSQPNLTSTSEVLSIYKFPTKISGLPQKFWEQKKFWTTYRRLPHSTQHISGTQRRNAVAWTNRNANVNIKCVPR